jgi:hypothetical protein
LACVLSIAYYYASNDYIIHRELATGKGFADLVLIPRKNVDSPAIIIELKYDKAVDTAIEQIKRTADTLQATELDEYFGYKFDRAGTPCALIVTDRWGAPIRQEKNEED